MENTQPNNEKLALAALRIATHCKLESTPQEIAQFNQEYEALTQEYHYQCDTMRSSIADTLTRAAFYTSIMSAFNDAICKLVRRQWPYSYKAMMAKEMAN